MCPLPVSECFTCTISLDLIAPLWPTEIASDGQGCFPGSTGGGAAVVAQRGQDVSRVGHLKLGDVYPPFITLVSLSCIYWNSFFNNKTFTDQ